jgi:hypothetical protein
MFRQGWKERSKGFCSERSLSITLAVGLVDRRGAPEVLATSIPRSKLGVSCTPWAGGWGSEGGGKRGMVI